MRYHIKFMRYLIKFMSYLEVRINSKTACHILVRDYSDVQRLFCQTSWGRGTSELVPYK